MYGKYDQSSDLEGLHQHPGQFIRRTFVAKRQTQRLPATVLMISQMVRKASIYSQDKVSQGPRK